MFIKTKSTTLSWADEHDFNREGKGVTGKEGSRGSGFIYLFKLFKRLHTSFIYSYIIFSNKIDNMIEMPPN